MDLIRPEDIRRKGQPEITLQAALWRLANSFFNTSQRNENHPLQDTVLNREPVGIFASSIYKTVTIAQRFQDPLFPANEDLRPRTHGLHLPTPSPDLVKS